VLDALAAAWESPQALPLDVFDRTFMELLFESPDAEDQVIESFMCQGFLVRSFRFGGALHQMRLSPVPRCTAD
jgi:hypothetical protein